MSKKIKLDIVSDVICPWCIIGYKRLALAITALGLENKVEIEWQPFQLNPDMPPEGEEIRAHIKRKYGTTPEQSDNFRKEMTELGAELGFTFNYFDGMKAVNTLDAHILLEYAKTEGKQTEFKNRLFAAFHTEGKDISDQNVLMAEIESINLSKDKAITFLHNDSLREEILNQEQQWKQLGISGVPTVIFNRESAVTGAQPVEVYKEVLADFAKAL